MIDEQFDLENTDKESIELNILFFHNTLPEYRIGCFDNLAKRANVEFVFTNEKQNEKDYGFKIEYEKAKKMRCIFLPEGNKGIQELRQIIKNVEKYDFVELPPMDSVREVIYSAYIIYKCRRKSVKTGYFWEKWDAPLEKQPMKRRIKNFILRIIPGIIYKQVDVIFSTGKKNREYFVSNGVNENKIVWIPDVSETPECEYCDLREMYRIPTDSKIILYLGRMLPQKGVQNLIKAYAMLDEDIKNANYLMIAGDGENLENCRALAKKLKIKNITFVGSVKPSIRGNYFSQCDIFVYPVTYFKGRVDVWGLTINEAVQHGKIVIATDAVGSAYELIENGINGYRIEPDNIKQLNNALMMTLDPKIVETTRKKDEELTKLFNFEMMAKLYIRAIVNCG